MRLFRSKPETPCAGCEKPLDLRGHVAIIAGVGMLCMTCAHARLTRPSKPRTEDYRAWQVRAYWPDGSLADERVIDAPSAHFALEWAQRARAMTPGIEAARFCTCNPIGAVAP